MKVIIKHGEGSIIVRKFDYEDLAATVWIGNTNAEQEADAMLTKPQVEKLIEALSAVIDKPKPTAEGFLALYAPAGVDAIQWARKVVEAAPRGGVRIE